MTAVEEYTKYILNLITDSIDNDLSLQWLKDKIELETSLEYIEMEKQQIVDAYRKGFISDDIKLAGDYYNETFKSE